MPWRSRSALAAALLALAVALLSPSYGAPGPGLYGVELLGANYNVTLWDSPPSWAPHNWSRGAQACAAYCEADPRCCSYTYTCPDGGPLDPERCALKWGLPHHIEVPHKWSGNSSRATSAFCTPARPRFHNTPACLAGAGWHDIAAAVSVNGTHHVMQGCPAAGGWMHSVSSDLVHWQQVGVAPRGEASPYGPASPPCPGFLLPESPSSGALCAGYRQCNSTQGVPGGRPWDVPLSLHCTAEGNSTAWGAGVDMFVPWRARRSPYSPVRPWVDADGQWYTALAFDACNSSTTTGECALGGEAELWSSPALSGSSANWTRTGVLFRSNTTVMGPNQPLNGTFVTPEYIGALPGDVTGRQRVLINSVVGDGCCSGAPMYFIGVQPAPGAPLVVNFSDSRATGMLDWGTFVAGAEAGAVVASGEPSAALTGVRVLGSHSANQVLTPGRRVVVGGVNGGKWPQQTSQGLPRDLSLSPTGELLQAFVPELQALRVEPATAPGATGLRMIQGQALEFYVVFTVGPGGENADPFGLKLLTSPNGEDPGYSIWLDVAARVVHVADRAAPLLGSSSEISLHVFVDAAICEVIVNNRTALTVVHAPQSRGSDLNQLFGVGGAIGVKSAYWWEIASISDRARTAVA